MTSSEVMFKNPFIHILAVNGHRKMETPVPIPNTEVKHLHGIASTGLRPGKRAAVDTLYLFPSFIGAIMHKQDAFQGIKFRLVYPTENPANPIVPAVVKKGPEPAVMPFFKFLPMLEQLNSSLGTSIRVISSRTFVSLFALGDMSPWVQAFGQVSPDIGRLDFFMMPFIAFEKPGKPFCVASKYAEPFVAFQPDFTLYEDVSPKFRNYLAAFLYLPRKYQGQADSVIVIPDFSMRDIKVVKQDIRIKLPVRRMELLKNLPQYDGWYEFEDKFVLPFGEDNAENPLLPFFRRPSHEYVGPMFGAIDLERPNRKDIRLYGDWSRNSALVVEIPLADLSTLRQRALILGFDK